MEAPLDSAEALPRQPFLLRQLVLERRIPAALQEPRGALPLKAGGGETGSGRRIRPQGGRGGGIQRERPSAYAPLFPPPQRKGARLWKRSGGSTAASSSDRWALRAGAPAVPVGRGKGAKGSIRTIRKGDILESSPGPPLAGDRSAAVDENVLRGKTGMTLDRFICGGYENNCDLAKKAQNR